MPTLALNVHIVTFGNVATIDACLESVLRQSHGPTEVVVLDNASRDGTLERLAVWAGRGVTVLANDHNAYYARAHNDLLRRSAADFVLTLNPDAALHPDFLARALEAFGRSPTIGSVNGRLLVGGLAELRCAPLVWQHRPDGIIDSAGLMLFKSHRPYLRGFHQPAGRACRTSGYVFGADGASAVYRRAMLDDVAPDGEFFDEDFAIYREDVDLAWRAQLLGWDAYYCPEALGVHIRRFRPGHSRRAIDAALRRHGLKNGWLLLLKNADLPTLLRHAPRVAAYQSKIAAGLLATEPRSGAALADVARLLPRMREKRRSLHARRRRPPAALRRWLV